MTPPRSDLRSPPPQGGAAGGPAEPDPRRPLEGAASLAAAALGQHFAALLDLRSDTPAAEPQAMAIDEAPPEPRPTLPLPGFASREQSTGDDSPKDRRPELRLEPDLQSDAPLEPRAPDAMPSPMTLFSRTPEPTPLREPAAPPPESLSTQLALRIETLAVSTEQDGHRRVRLSLADNALPETDVELAHDAGELQVAFFCRSASGRQALEQQAPNLAETLAQRLQQPVSVSVGGSQRDEPGRVTAQARPRDQGSA